MGSDVFPEVVWVQGAVGVQRKVVKRGFGGERGQRHWDVPPGIPVRRLYLWCTNEVRV